MAMTKAEMELLAKLQAEAKEAKDKLAALEAKQATAPTVEDCAGKVYVETLPYRDSGGGITSYAEMTVNDKGEPVIVKDKATRTSRWWGEYMQDTAIVSGNKPVAFLTVVRVVGKATVTQNPDGTTTIGKPDTATTEPVKRVKADTPKARAGRFALTL